MLEAQIKKRQQEPLENDQTEVDEGIEDKIKSLTSKFNDEKLRNLAFKLRHNSIKQTLGELTDKSIAGAQQELSKLNANIMKKSLLVREHKGRAVTVKQTSDA